MKDKEQYGDISYCMRNNGISILMIYDSGCFISDVFIKHTQLAFMLLL